MIWALWTLLALADTRVVDTAPSEVVVYADRARVTRTATVDLPAGQHSIVFERLPSTLLDTGVSAELTGGGVLGAIDVRKVAASEVADARVAEIERELDRLGDARRVAKDEETASTRVLEQLVAGKAAAAKALSQQLLYGTRAAERVRLVRTKVGAEEERVRDAIREAQREGRELDEQMEALRRERSTLGTSGTDTHTATVRIDLARPGRITVDLAYLVRGATWRPRYDVRGSTSTGKVDLSLSALVTQRTGEDWTDVKLAVTTARAGQGTDVPTLDPFWLEPPVYYAPPVSRSMSAGAPAMAAPMAEMEDSYDAEPAPMEVAVAVVQMDLAATTFEVARDESVPSDGTERKVLLTTVAMDADLRHVVVPRVDPRAFLVGEVTNTAPFALLEGEAGVFLDGAYLGDFLMSRVAPGATFDVAFGVDDGVKVSRRSRAMKIGDVGLGGKRATSTWAWDVAIKNTHARALTIELREQVPVSGQSDVTVTWKVLDGGPTPTEEAGGILVFAFDLPSRGERTTSWSYQIDYPADRWLGWME